VSRDVTEIIFIFVFSTLAFVLYIIRDYQFLRYEKESKERKKEATRLSKELSSSYSYIGEVNRKFEILKDITLEIPELLENGKKNGKDIYADVLRAIRIFSGCRNFMVILFSQKEKKRYAELFLPDSNLVSVPSGIDIEEIIRGKTHFTKRKGGYCVIEANGTMAGLHCLGIFRHTSLRDDAIDLVRPLLMQTLLLYVYSKNMRYLPIPNKEGRMKEKEK
jgi:hypothetical protein